MNKRLCVILIALLLVIWAAAEVKAGFITPKLQSALERLTPGSDISVIIT
ncbi:MAG: hypothetical protein JRI85_15340, partial [Deltaproteobacteria bacterium]|nr:hypothetical protein [Deltaproteobacteria bacterium]